MSLNVTRTHPACQEEPASGEGRRQGGVGGAELVETDAEAAGGDRYIERVAAHGPEDVERRALAETLQRLPRPRDDEPARALAEQVPQRVVGRAEVEGGADGPGEAALCHRHEEAAFGDVMRARQLARADGLANRLLRRPDTGGIHRGQPVRK